MSGSGRKRVSKWDLKEESQFSLENVQDTARPGNAGMSFRDKESQPEWFSPEVAGSNAHRWSVKEANDMLKSKRDLELPSREPFPGGRGSRKDDSITENSTKYMKATTAWDGDESYGTKMSPGLDDWRQQNHRHSPKNDWNRPRRSRSRSQSRSQSRSWSRSRSRSRSRSPVRGFRRESGVYDKSRSKTGVSTQLCKDFAAGRCRRGNHCQFLHQGDQNYEDSWESRHRKAGGSKYSTPHDSREYPARSGRSAECCSDFIKGKCRRGASCRYVHSASDGFGKGAANEVIRERENDRRNRDGSSDRGSEREPRRSGDIPCKFFAAGNCRNGKYCRFSHHGHAHLSPDRKSQDDKWLVSHGSDDVEKLWDGPKWSNKNNLSDAAKLSGDKSGRMGASKSRFTAWSMDDKWGNSLDEIKTHVENEEEALPWKTENIDASVGVSESRAAENWLGDMDMSPEWNYGVRSSNLVAREEQGHITQSSQSQTLNDTSLPSREQNKTQEALGQMHDVAAIIQPMEIEKSYLQRDYNLREGGAIALPCDYNNAIEKNSNSHIDLNFSANQNGQILTALPFSSLNAVGQNQVAIPSEPSGGILKNPQNHALFQEGKSINKPDIGEANTSQVNSGIPPIQNVVSSEQLSQLTNLSASLAQLLENGKQLPQLYAALNPHNVVEVSSFATSEGPVELDSRVNLQPNQDIGPQRQYDPICDSIELKKHDVSDKPQGFSPNTVGQKSIVVGNPVIQSKNLSPSSFAGPPNGGDYRKAHSSETDPNHVSHRLDQQDPGADFEVTKEHGAVGAEESNKARDRNKIVQENGPLENIDGEGGADEGKKAKDVKGIRAFKFALAEFVKELLKPTWKEGQISKEAYKNIVKKVVDKVTGTLQGANIPQTPEKIDQYLSFSKPKLTKLVQAYVEKFQKV